MLEWDQQKWTPLLRFDPATVKELEGDRFSTESDLPPISSSFGDAGPGGNPSVLWAFGRASRRAWRVIVDETKMSKPMLLLR
jgi:hypothetical protein